MQSNITRRQFLQIGVSSATGLILMQTGCGSSEDYMDPNIIDSDVDSDIMPSGLMASLMETSLGIRPEEMRLSWLVPKLNMSTIQFACQIQFALKVEDLDVESMLVWDSGMLKSTSSIAVPYSGDLSLQSDQAYYWRVKVWADETTVSSWSAAYKIVTALPTEQWTGLPIWLPSDIETTNNWLLTRKTFFVDLKEIDTAWIRITAQSPETARQYVFRLWVNGKLVGLGPVRSMGDEARYHTFDLDSLLNQNDNVVAALCYSDSNRAFLAELVVNYRDGNQSVIVTDESWKTLSGDDWRPFNGFINNVYYQAPKEYIDAREEPIGWQDIGFDDSDWKNAKTQLAITSLEPAWVDSMQVTYLKPESIRFINEGHWVLDFGKEIVGGIRIDVEGFAGQTIELRLGEELNDDLSVRYRLRSGPTYQEVWTLRDGQQRLEHWGYRAFRWVEVITSPELNSPNGILACILKMAWNNNHALFESSDQDLNKVWEFCRYSIEATRQDLYQDTPTRERGAYKGDAIINQLSEYCTQRSYALARYSVSYLLRRPTWPTEYRLQIAILAWQDYLHTGDQTNLINDYQLMVEHQLIDNLNPQGLLEKEPGKSSQSNGDLVDWPINNRDGFVFTRVNCVINAWQYASLVALSNIADVLGYEYDKTYFVDLANQLKKSVNQSLLTDRFTYRDGLNTEHESQHASAFSLALGITLEADVSKVGASLKSDIENRGIQVSVYGAQFVLDGLYRAKEGEAAHDLLVSRGLFSWLHMIEDLDATIVMEAWDPSIKPNTTFSHAWGSAPANVIQRHIVGVKILEPGAAKVLVEPQPGHLNWFEAKVPTIRGSVAVIFKRNESNILSIELPPNVEGELLLNLRQMLDVESIGNNEIKILNAKDELLEQEVDGFMLSVKNIKPGLTIVRIIES
ncbi:MAG: alpha-L-rhamnosidase [Paraglaciecola sp.]|jgi:alpha-L-rhamnosidase